MPDISPQQRIDPPLSKSGIFKGLRWAGGGLLITILGTYITRWLDPYLILLPTIIGYNPSSALSQINFSWLPPLSIMLTALILGYIAYLYVQRAQSNAIKEINDMQVAYSSLINQAEEDMGEKIREANQEAKNELICLEKENAEWIEMCEGLKDYLTPEIDTWEVQRKAGNIANVTNLGQTMLNQRKLFYDKATQKLKENKDKKTKN